MLAEVVEPIACNFWPHCARQQPTKRLCFSTVVYTYTVTCRLVINDIYAGDQLCTMAGRNLFRCGSGNLPLQTKPFFLICIKQYIYEPFIHRPCTPYILFLHQADDLTNIPQKLTLFHPFTNVFSVPPT